MEIKLIESADAKNFVEFYKKLAKETPYLMFTPEEVEQKADEQKNFIKKYDDYKQVFIAVEDGKIVGYLGIARSHLSKITHTAKFTVAVLDEHKRQKIASKLLKVAEKWAKEKGIKRLELTVTTDNEAAIALFENAGFETEGTRKKSVKLKNKAVDELFMAKVF